MSSMPALSAPSAKILHFELVDSLHVRSCGCDRLLENPVGGFAQRRDGRVRLRLESLVVAVADQNGAAAGAAARFDVAPSVADHEALGERDVDRVSRRAAACRASACGNRNCPHRRAGTPRSHRAASASRRCVVHRLDGRARDPSARDVGLIGHHHEPEARPTQSLERRCGVGEQSPSPPRCPANTACRRARSPR